jgi:hypothetical protein
MGREMGEVLGGSVVPWYEKEGGVDPRGAQRERSKFGILWPGEKRKRLREMRGKRRSGGTKLSVIVLSLFGLIVDDRVCIGRGG